MKKIYLLLVVSILLCGNGAMAQTQRTVLVEEFSQASCPDCPFANGYLDPIFAANTGKVVVVKYQTSLPGYDVMNIQDTDDIAARENFYEVEFVPYAYVDGNINVPSDDPYNISQSALDAEAAIPSPVSMTATYNYDSITDSVFSTIVVKNVSGSALMATSAQSLKLFVSLVEMNIHFITNAPGDNGEYDFYYVSRKMYPDANGFTLPDTLLNGDSVVYQLNALAPGYIYNTKEMAIAAFVQDSDSYSVYQSVLATPANVTDEIMVDNTSSYPVCNSVTPSLILTNNGPTPLTSATVGYVNHYDTLNPIVSQPWTGNLAYGQSATITLAAIPVPEYSIFNYFVNNLNGGTLIDINDANNSPDRYLNSIPDDGAMDSLSEQFESSVGYWSTPISINSVDPFNAYSFVGDLDYITTYWGFTSDTVPVGGYAQSDASYFFFLTYADSVNQQEGLIFDKVNRLGYTDSILTFQHAYAGYYSNDELDVQISTDCGLSWTTVWSKAGNTLATSPDVNPNSYIFSPSATQWATDTVNVSAYNNENGVIVQFVATSQFGNALYIDNINWGLGSPTLGIHDIAGSLSASVYPNPAGNKVNLALSLTQAGRYNINLLNVLGQTVKTVYGGDLAAGDNNISVDVADLSSGIYNFVIESNDQVLVKRFYVAR